MFGKLVCSLIVITTAAGVRLLDPTCLVDSTVDAEGCCKVPDYIDPTVIDKCLKEIMGNKAPSSNETTSVEEDEITIFAPPLRCLSQCILNETGSYKDGKIQTQAATKAFTTSTSVEWTPVITSTITTCQSIVTKTHFDPPKAGECSYVPSFFFGCMDTQLFKNCPENNWNNKPGCSQMKETAEKCPIVGSIVKMD